MFIKNRLYIGVWLSCGRRECNEQGMENPMLNVGPTVHPVMNVRTEGIPRV
jgi:hypothetical protein